MGPWIFFASNGCGAALLAQEFFKETHQWDGNGWKPKCNLQTAAVLGALEDPRRALKMIENECHGHEKGWKSDEIHVIS